MNDASANGVRCFPENYSSASATDIADLAGRWATDPDYASSIARVGSRLFGER